MELEKIRQKNNNINKKKKRIRKTNKEIEEKI